ncbi:MAG: M24 family metallopeptidase [Candidatus Heimdallarchaeaceae archaeon]
MILEQDYFTKEDFLIRVQKHQQALKEVNIDFSVIQYKSDLYYYSGTGQSCILIIPAENDPILFVRRVLERTKEEAKLEHLIPIRRTKELYQHLKEHKIPVEGGKFGFEGDVLPYDMAQKIISTFPNKTPVSIGHVLRMIRSVKSEKEIKVMAESAKILDEVHTLVPELIKEGMTEVELSGKLYAEIRKRGGQALVRSRDFYTEAGGNGLVLSGKNSGVASYTLTASAGPGLHQSNPFGPSKKKLHAGEMVLVDLSVSYNGYITDETRCYEVGNVETDIVEKYALQRQIEQKMVELMRIGKNTMEIYKETYDFAKELNIEKNLMLGGEIPFLAHGVGLELNDYPVITRKFDYVLKEGNVLALEPKLIFPGKLTLGSENTYAIKNGKVIVLTNAPHPLLE